MKPLIDALVETAFYALWVLAMWIAVAQRLPRRSS